MDMRNTSKGYEMKPHMPRVTCKDGVSFSMQVGSYLHCLPRDSEGPYTHVEIGFIHDKEGKQVTPGPSWEEWADGSFPSDVYGYVPITVVENFIELHGGMDLGKTWANTHWIKVS